MTLEFLDANIIIRHVAQDHPEHSERARRFLQEIEHGTTTVTTSESVINEVVFGLSSKVLYNLPRKTIQEFLSTIIRMPNLKLAHKETYLRALELYATTNVDFVDALNVAHMERLGIQTIVSFDRHFDRIQGITRREP